MKRVILIMSLVLIYSFAFVFVKIYADKSIISADEPSDASLIHEKEAKPSDEADILPAVMFDVTETAEAVTTTAPQTVSVPTDSSSPEQLVNKKVVGAQIMKLAAATRVSDIEIAPDTENKAETMASAEAETEPVTKQSEKKSKAASISKILETNTPLKVDESSDGDSEEEFDDSDSEYFDDDSEEDYVDDSLDVQEISDDAGFTALSDEELDALLNRLGASSIDELLSQQPSSGLPNDIGGYIGSSGSYKNEIVTIYDTSIGGLRTDNAYNLVCEIVNEEVGDSFEFEAIKAQAVAAYTYIKYYEQKGEYAELGTEPNPSSTIKRAVDAVDGLALYYDGNYIMTPFSASQGGFSASSKNVWGGDLPYLKSVKNDYDYLDTKYYGLQTTYTVDEIRQKIESKTDIKLSENYSEWIRILSYNDSIYAGQLSIDGHTSAYVSGKERTLTGHIFRTYILNIKSSAFTVSYANGIFTFTTYGYGHGVGLSQIGANLYAKNGYSFDQILMHYFTGVTIK